MVSGHEHSGRQLQPFGVLNKERLLKADVSREFFWESSGRITVGADRGYDTRDFVWDCRDMHITPHVAQRRHSAIDGRTTRHGGYRLSQRVRKRVEEEFGWVKTVGGGRKLRYLGVGRNQMWAELTVAGYNLVRLARLAQSPA